MLRPAGLALLLLVQAWAVTPSSKSQVEVDNRRVILIGLDGLRADALKKAVQEIRRQKRYPHFLSLFDQGVFDYTITAGGVQGSGTEQETSSGPGWATILTGVWADRHNVRSDLDMQTGKFDDRYPTIFNYIGRLFPEMSSIALVDWWPLAAFVKTTAQGAKPREVHARRSDDLADYIQNDGFLVDETIRSLRTDKPKFIFLYLGAIEQTGVAKGYGPDNAKYMEAVMSKASQINSIVEEIAEQRRRKSLDWLVVLCSDHGGTGRRSGSQSASDRSVFVVYQNPSDPRYAGGRELFTYAAIDAITPTIVDFLAPHKFRPRSSRYKYLGNPMVTAAAAAPVVSVILIAAAFFV